ncbi:MAG: hypothetical protein ACK5Z5_09805 [Neisseriaceae bacterium]
MNLNTDNNISSKRDLSYNDSEFLNKVNTDNQLLGELKKADNGETIKKLTSELEKMLEESKADSSKLDQAKQIIASINDGNATDEQYQKLTHLSENLDTNHSKADTLPSKLTTLTHEFVESSSSELKQLANAVNTQAEDQERINYRMNSIAMQYKDYMNNQLFNSSGLANGLNSIAGLLNDDSVSITIIILLVMLYASETDKNLAKSIMKDITRNQKRTKFLSDEALAAFQGLNNLYPGTDPITGKDLTDDLYQLYYNAFYDDSIKNDPRYDKIREDLAPLKKQLDSLAGDDPNKLKIKASFTSVMEQFFGEVNQHLTSVGASTIGKFKTKTDTDGVTYFVIDTATLNSITTGIQTGVNVGSSVAQEMFIKSNSAMADYQGKIQASAKIIDIRSQLLQAIFR